ncbi:hypothetical protein Q7P37_007696 [Cladosporium fusiforme]
MDMHHDMTATSSDMPMATSSSSSMDMGDMDMSGHSMGGMTMSMADMAMVFFTSTKTPLYSNSWTPNNSGQYAGTCIFLIILAVIFRALLAVRCNVAGLRAWFSPHRALSHPEEAHHEHDDWKQPPPTHRPWNINEALLRAIMDTVLAGASYLMMLAVMTMNVGYFMSIIGGVFLGSFAFGGWTGASSH